MRAIAATRYRSGYCGTAQHDRCRGAYGGVPCSCTCHQPTPVCSECGRPLEAAAHA